MIDSLVNTHAVGVGLDDNLSLTNYYQGHIWQVCFYSEEHVTSIEVDKCVPAPIYCSSCPVDVCLVDCDHLQTTGDIKCVECQSECTEGCVRTTDCEQCHDALCVECDNWSTCTQCTDNATLTDGSCECNAGFFADGPTCEPCSQHCDVCVDQFDCTTCTINYYLYMDTYCYQYCPDGYVRNGTNRTCDLEVLEPICTQFTDKEIPSTWTSIAPPIAIYERGVWFDGTNYLKGVNFIHGFDFIIEFYVKLVGDAGHIYSASDPDEGLIWAISYTDTHTLQLQLYDEIAPSVDFTNEQVWILLQFEMFPPEQGTTNMILSIDENQ